MAFQFKKAVRSAIKLRLAISGPSGSGKTFSSLLLARGLVGPNGKIAVIDTERGSASLYDKLTEYDVLDLDPPYSPERFIEAIKAAENALYDAIIIDSATHEWDGSGGCLEINEKLAKAKYKGNTWSAWSDTTPRHQAFIDAINQSKCHVICTMRSKIETVQEGGQVKKLGMKDVQREGTDYEFTIAFNLTHDSNLAIASKDRTGLFKTRDPFKITTSTGEIISEWIRSGAPLLPTPQVAATPEPTESLFHKACKSIEGVATMEALKVWYDRVKSVESQFTQSEMVQLVKLKDDVKAKLTQPAATPTPTVPPQDGLPESDPY